MIIDMQIWKLQRSPPIVLHRRLTQIHVQSKHAEDNFIWLQDRHKRSKERGRSKIQEKLNGEKGEIG